jgi:hypothetical protein
MDQLTRKSFLSAMMAIAQAQNRSLPSVAFHYSAVFTPEEVRWFTRFAILVTGGILSPEQTSALRTGRNQLVAYEWSSAFYPEQRTAAPFVEDQRWLLNTVPVGGAAAERPAMWFDFGNEHFVRARAAYLAAMLEKTGYDGLFFDTLGYSHLPPPIRAEYERRHPGLDYEKQQGAFLRALRGRIGRTKLLFLNQGYRNADVYLPYADLDLTESYFTRLAAPGSTPATIFQPWSNARAPWESIRLPMTNLVRPAALRYPRVVFCHLNYAAGDGATIRRAIQYSQAAARLWNHQAYLVASDAGAERSEAYFMDLGRPLTRSHEEDRQKELAWREFENGVVAINAGRETGVIPHLKLTLPDPPRGFIFPRKR